MDLVILISCSKKFKNSPFNCFTENLAWPACMFCCVCSCVSSSLSASPQTTVYTISFIWLSSWPIQINFSMVTSWTAMLHRWISVCGGVYVCFAAQKLTMFVLETLEKCNPLWQDHSRWDMKAIVARRPNAPYTSSTHSHTQAHTQACVYILWQVFSESKSFDFPVFSSQLQEEKEKGGRVCVCVRVRASVCFYWKLHQSP